MKKISKKHILKIRPFNMANFSGGSGYLPFVLFFEYIALLPYFALVVIPSIFLCGKTKKIDEETLKEAENGDIEAIEAKNDKLIDSKEFLRRLNIFVLPILIFVAVGLYVFILVGGFCYDSGIFGRLFELFCAIIPSGSIYAALLLTVKRERYLSRQNLFGGALWRLIIIAILSGIIGYMFCVLL